jgi:hypothetical protein
MLNKGPNAYLFNSQNKIKNETMDTKNDEGSNVIKIGHSLLEKYKFYEQNEGVEANGHRAQAINFLCFT